MAKKLKKDDPIDIEGVKAKILSEKEYPFKETFGEAWEVEFEDGTSGMVPEKKIKKV